MFLTICNYLPGSLTLLIALNILNLNNVCVLKEWLWIIDFRFLLWATMSYLFILYVQSSVNVLNNLPKALLGGLQPGSCWCHAHSNMRQNKQINQSVNQSNQSKSFLTENQRPSWRLHIAKWRGEEKTPRGSMAAMRCQTLRCEENKPVNQLWQSLRGTLTTLFYCVASTEEISFFINFLCLHLFECKYDTARAALLFLVRWSLATNESFMRGFIFKERKNIRNF